MHQQCRELLSGFCEEYDVYDQDVLDVGSCDVNGNNRELFKGYTGIDIVSGPNVDIVVKPYQFPFDDNRFDVVISTNTLEHVEDTRRWMKEVARVGKNLFCIIVPAMGFGYHPHPVDCWRVYPDGMRWLLKEAGLSEVTIELHNGRSPEAGKFTDLYCVAEKI